MIKRLILKFKKESFYFIIEKIFLDRHQEDHQNNFHFLLHIFGGRIYLEEEFFFQPTVLS